MKYILLCSIVQNKFCHSHLSLLLTTFYRIYTYISCGLDFPDVYTELIHFIDILLPLLMFWTHWHFVLLCFLFLSALRSYLCFVLLIGIPPSVSLFALCRFLNPFRLRGVGSISNESFYYIQVKKIGMRF